ncbi:MAG: ArsR/SmtB family transcription factor [Gemmatimonadota bacterium]
MADVKDAGPLVLTDSGQLRALGSPLRVAMFESLAQGPASVRALAARLGVPRTRLYHHLGVLQESGLIEVVSRRTVRGRTERTYGAASTEVSLDPALVAAGPGRGPIRAAFRLAEDELVAAAAHDADASVVLEQEIGCVQPDDYDRLRQGLLDWFDEVRAAHDPSAEVDFRVTLAFHPTSPDR